MPFSIMVLSDYMPTNKIVASYHRFILFFKGISTLSSIVAVSIYIPINSSRGFILFHTLSGIYYLQISLMIAILTSVRYYLILVLICISLIMNNIDHLFMCLVAICMYSLEKYLFRSHTHIFTGLFIFLKMSCMNCGILWKLILC